MTVKRKTEAAESVFALGDPTKRLAGPDGQSIVVMLPQVVSTDSARRVKQLKTDAQKQKIIDAVEKLRDRTGRPWLTKARRQTAIDLELSYDTVRRATRDIEK